MNETSFVRSVHRKLPEDIYAWKINCRFENGVPDAWYRGSFTDIFVEYKFVILPKRETTLVKAQLSKPQYRWLTERQKQGVHVAVIIGSDEGGVWFDNVDEAYTGIPTKEFRRRCCEPAELVEFIVETVHGLWPQ